MTFTFNIKEAESAKVIENIQRDLNIGLMNEIYKVCYKSNINFKNVIKLASTKWNFLKFNPGLVGGIVYQLIHIITLLLQRSTELRQI